ncbi:Cupin 2 conserved barrel domain protein [Gloeothece citriformis PCC 7424]|uniref:Cupin 2 conserved barrel domain protein n=1 Tax=Gloeothece citriformis (strain PCC 7424) TaxID=65393 RepID=B7KJH3_GLOC7|nr:cupin domain-containing protein [Gloeothece citriformis]ACK73650.1 Cupin 2 conserved barrel domain protein [Gloeothece citriformis PCC 7424]
MNNSTLTSDHCMIPVIKSPKDYQVFRITPHDTNRLAIVFDSTSADDSLTVCVEIFDPGGSTPTHRHNFAVEMFFILKGEGMAICDGKNIPLHPGDSLLVRPTGIHEIRNVGSQRLYAICFMVPNEDFSELIRSGVPEELDEEDLKVLQGIGTF